MTNPFMSDQDLLHTAAERLGIDAQALMHRYYGSWGDALQEMEQFHSTGQLQESFAAMLRMLLDTEGMSIAPAHAQAAGEPKMA
ncbi:hypothetical protein [Geminicoccus harenae]|uniref:hypothetical protein n=1 Tax=Geminicoccus harenae TaxID=2498453 RepID=UPI00168A4754|nr:hypothetical protein [Geminicoccus harenae]